MSFSYNHRGLEEPRSDKSYNTDELSYNAEELSYNTGELSYNTDELSGL